MNLSKIFNRNSIDNKKESYKYVANTLIDLYHKEEKKVFSFTSSSMTQTSCLEILEIFCNHIRKKNLEVLIIQACIPENKTSPEVSDHKDKSLLKFNDLSSDELKEIIIEHQEKYDLILVLIPSVILKADALEYAKVCDRTILIEKYMYCYYSNYEETLLHLANSGIKPQGVITVV